MVQHSGEQKIFVWDVDGVILDSAKETHVMTVESLKRNKALVEKALGKNVNPYSFSQFYEDRPYVDRVHHYFVHPVSRTLLGKKGGQLSNKEREKVYGDYKDLFEQLSKTFYAARKEMQAKDIAGWHRLSPVYPGIPEAMKELNEAGFKFVVVSSKDRATISEALKYNGLDKFFKDDDIIDQTAGKDRKEQMQKMLSKYGPNAEYVVLDDVPENHVLSKETLGHAKARFFGAKWGYGIGWGKHGFITVVKSPRELARELHLKAVLKEYVTHHRGVFKVPFLGHYVFGERVSREQTAEKKLQHVIAYVLIRDKHGNVFLQKRSASKKDYPGMYSISASGHVKHLESLEKAAARETEEELGVKVKNLRPLWKKPVAIDPKLPHRLFFPFVADYSGEFKPNAEEVSVSETRFYNPQEIERIIEAGKATPSLLNFLKLIGARKATN